MNTGQIRSTFANATESGKICLAVNYLLWTDPTRQMWIDLDRHLDEFGCRLVLLTTSLPEIPLPFPVLLIPFLLRDYASQFPGAGRAGGQVSAGDLELLQADSIRSNRAYPAGEALTGLFACRQLCATVLHTLQPRYVLTWDPASPLALILQSLAREAGLPVQGMERGFLSETLMIESRGIQAWSDLRMHWLAQDLPASASDTAAYERIRAHYLAHKPQKYAQADFGGGGLEIRRRLGLEDKKVIVFLGSWEADGVASRGGLCERCFLTGFPTNLEALLALRRLVKQMPGATLLFKPHPLDKQSYVVAKLEGVQIVQDVNVHALMDAADVVVAQYTTLQFEAAFYDKPVLLLARSAWWGRNAAYEVEFPEDLPAMLTAALERHDWPARQANGHAFITWVMDQFLIACTDQVPARRNLRDLARFIAVTSLDARRLPPPEVRWEHTLQAVEGLKANGAPGAVNVGAIDPVRSVPKNTTGPLEAAPSASAHPAPQEAMPFSLTGLNQFQDVAPVPLPRADRMKVAKPMIFHPRPGNGNSATLGNPPPMPPGPAFPLSPSSNGSNGSNGNHSHS